jgi:hypothetical protein
MDRKTEVCEMQKAEVVLSILSQKATQKKEYVFDRLYRNLFNPDFYLLAYNNIYPNEGNMTAGPEPETNEGINIDKVNTLIAMHRQETYRPKPVRRTVIPKKN